VQEELKDVKKAHKNVLDLQDESVLFVWKCLDASRQKLNFKPKLPEKYRQKAR